MLTRRGFLIAGATALARPGNLLRQQQATRPLPSAAQLAWQRDQLALFVHFGVNTFTDREWGDGKEDPRIFNPTKLDTRQWARSARTAGFRSMILTAKHHDGFCLWPSHTTDHSVARSPWRAGNGDLVREFVDACRGQGVKPGLYCSPWDRNAPSYGDSDRYNDFYCDQLTELLSFYGPIHEVWFDGANGEGPNGKRQVYDWPRYWSLVRRLQPNALIFSDAGPDIRWIGNERGEAGDPNWSTVDPAVVPYPGAEGEAVTRMLQHGDPAGSVWRPGESDVSIRPGWFYHAAEDNRVKTVDQLIELYFKSVGRNSKLLLNVPPTRDGVLHELDVARLASMRERLDALFRDNLAAERSLDWRMVRGGTALAEMDLGRTVTIAMADLREDIAQGQMVGRYTLEGANGFEWQTISQGTTIGARKLDRFAPVQVRYLRLRIDETFGTPRIFLGLYPP